ncbi:MAG: hypothetical protein FWC41_09555 [Firmicutes bacterium]|nr:hypothetical protein [Bacillota bacterium]
MNSICKLCGNELAPLGFEEEIKTNLCYSCLYEPISIKTLLKALQRKYTEEMFSKTSEDYSGGIHRVEAVNLEISPFDIKCEYHWSHR